MRRSATSHIVRSLRRLGKLTFGDLVAAAFDAVGGGPRAAEKVAEILATGKLRLAVVPRVQVVRRNS